MKERYNKTKTLYKELKERWKSESPLFWKEARNYAIKIGVIAVSVLGADKLFDLQDVYGVSSLVFTIAGYVIVACATLGLSAQITKP